VTTVGHAIVAKEGQLVWDAFQKLLDELDRRNWPCMRAVPLLLRGNGDERQPATVDAIIPTMNRSSILIVCITTEKRAREVETWDIYQGTHRWAAICSSAIDLSSDRMRKFMDHFQWFRFGHEADVFIREVLGHLDAENAEGRERWEQAKASRQYLRKWRLKSPLDTK